MDGSLPGFSVHGIFPGKSTGVGCHCLRTLTKPWVWEEIVVTKINFLLLSENIAHMQRQDPWCFWFKSDLVPLLGFRKQGEVKNIIAPLEGTNFLCVTRMMQDVVAHSAQEIIFVYVLIRVRLFVTSVNCSPPGSSVHEEFPGKNTAVGCHFLLQGVFLTQG